MNATHTLTGDCGDVRVDVRVTDDTSGPAEVYHWKYTFTEVSYQLSEPGYSNDYELEIDFDTRAARVSNAHMTTSGQLNVVPVGIGGGLPDYRDGFLPGNTFDITFDTPARPIGLGLASMTDSYNVDDAEEMVETPAPAAAASTTTEGVSVVWQDANRLPTGTTFAATVTGNAQAGAPTGAVKFMAGAAVLGTGRLVPGANGVSTVTVTGAAPAVGSRQITAEYQGDATYQPSTSAAVQVDLDVGTENDPALAPNTQPTGGNLKWTDFSTTVPQGATGAYTSGFSQKKFDREIVTLTTVADGVANSQARLKITATQFRAIFDRAGSWADANVRSNVAAIKHENLHLTINEWLATRAAANRPSPDTRGGAQNSDISVAKADAKAIAVRQSVQLELAFLTKWSDIIVAAAKAYDSGTSLPGPVNGGSDAAKQADWEANWQAKLQPLLTNNGWN